MSLTKLAFMGMHYRTLGPKESEAYVQDREKMHTRMHSLPVKAALTGVSAGLYGGLGAAIAHSEGLSNKAKLAYGLGGAAFGAGLQQLTHRYDKKQHVSNIERLKDPSKKWVVFGKGKSNLDNE